MAKRYEKPTKIQLKKHIEKRISNVTILGGFITLVALAFIRGKYGKESFPDIVFWFVGAVLIPDLLKFLKERQ